MIGIRGMVFLDSIGLMSGVTSELRTRGFHYKRINFRAASAIVRAVGRCMAHRLG